MTLFKIFSTSSVVKNFGKDFGRFGADSEIAGFESIYFSSNDVSALELLPDDVRLDDPIKKEILVNMFSTSRVHCIYGAAGTGKTTLVNHISNLMLDTKRIYLAKTHPAVENLRRKVVASQRPHQYEPKLQRYLPHGNAYRCGCGD